MKGWGRRFASLSLRSEKASSLLSPEKGRVRVPYLYLLKKTSLLKCPYPWTWRKLEQGRKGKIMNPERISIERWDHKLMSPLHQDSYSFAFELLAEWLEPVHGHDFYLDKLALFFWVLLSSGRLNWRTGVDILGFWAFLVVIVTSDILFFVYSTANHWLVVKTTIVYNLCSFFIFLIFYFDDISWSISYCEISLFIFVFLWL